MNYLGGYVFNHGVCQVVPEPHFEMGVALPDLWPRFSRGRRIRWECVRQGCRCDPSAVWDGVTKDRPGNPFAAPVVPVRGLWLVLVHAPHSQACPERGRRVRRYKGRAGNRP